MKINWDAKKCCHAGVCVKSLPAIFKVIDAEFVIEPANASNEEVKNAVKQCPSDALEMKE